jgi:hypothetical protein
MTNRQMQETQERLETFSLTLHLNSSNSARQDVLEKLSISDRNMKLRKKNLCPQ